jgi:outer membrane protein assembly factor BamB
MRATIAIAINVVGWLFSITGAMADEHSVALEVLWSVPIASSRPGTPYRPGPEPDLIFNAQAMYPDGRIVSLGSRVVAGKRVAALFADPEHNPPDNGIGLALKGAHPRNLHFLSRLSGSAPYPLALAAGVNGQIWVGGGINSYMDLASGDHSDAYVAKIDATGKTVWQKAYGNGGRRQISSMASLPTGEVVVAGEDAGEGWLARIGPDGSQLWERRLGNAKGNAIASLPGDRLVVAGFDPTGSASTKDYQDHVTAWIVDGSGEVLAQTRIRNAINTSSGSYFGRISVTATNDAIYVVSNWSDSFHAQPVEVSKLDLHGKLVWRRSLPDTTISIKSVVPTWRSCLPALALNPRRDVLVACALGGQIQVYQLEQLSGSYHESDLSLPDCNNGSATLFLAIRKDGTMILSGSRPGSNVAASCTWAGRLTEVR